MLHTTPAQDAPTISPTPKILQSAWHRCPKCGEPVLPPRQKEYALSQYRECIGCEMVYFPSCYVTKKERLYPRRRQLILGTNINEGWGAGARPNVCVVHYARPHDVHPEKERFYKPSPASLKRLQRLINRYTPAVYLDLWGTSVIYWFKGEVCNVA